MASSTDWNALHNPDIHVYAKRLIDKILEISKDCIPNKIVTIRLSDPPWITTSIKRYIRKRKKAYRRQTNFMNDWNTFRRFQNKNISMIRESKKALNESLSDKLKSDSLSPKQWWPYLKSFIALSSQASSPSLEKDGLVFVEEGEKANVLNDFFRDQTLLNDHDAALPEIAPYLVERCQVLSFVTR